MHLSQQIYKTKALNITKGLNDIFTTQSIIYAKNAFAIEFHEILV